MILIVGLGNPGRRYEKSRHNIGFMVLDELAREILPAKETKWEEDKKSNSLIINPQLLITNYQLPIILAKPQNFMNASGVAVKSLITNYQLLITNLWVIHDDLDLPLGKIKIVVGRGSAGHNGVESIIRELGSADFVRFRLGIGKPAKFTSENVMHREVERYVLEDFDGKDAVEAKKMIKKAIEAILLALEEGIEKAQATFC